MPLLRGVWGILRLALFAALFATASTQTSTATPSGTTSPTPTVTATITATPTGSATQLVSGTSTPTGSPSIVPTVSQTSTRSATQRPSASSTATSTPSIAPTVTPTATRSTTQLPSLTPTGSPTGTQPRSPTATGSASQRPSVPVTPTLTPSGTSTRASSASRSGTCSPTGSLSASGTSSALQTQAQSPTTSRPVSASATPTGSALASPTPSQSRTPNASAAFAGNVSSLATNASSSASVVVAGVQRLPDGCLTLYGETLTPVSFSLISTVFVQLTLAVLSVATDATRFVYFSAHALRLSVFTVAYLFSHLIHFFFICYSVTHLPQPEFSEFTPWDVYSLLYLRLWNSGFFAAAFAPVFIMIVHILYRDNVRDLIERELNSHWADMRDVDLTTLASARQPAGAAGDSDSPSPPTVENPLRVARASVSGVLGQAPHAKRASLAVTVSSATPGTSSLPGGPKSVHASMRHVLGLSDSHGRNRRGTLKRASRVTVATLPAVPSWRPDERRPLWEVLLPCFYWRPRNWVPPELRRAYWRKEPVSREVEYKMWRQWAYGKRDELVPLFPTTIAGSTFANCSWALFAVLLAIITPSLLTHVLPMAVFFILSTPAAFAIAAGVVAALFQLLGLMTEMVTPFGPDPRVVPWASKARTGLYMLFSILMLCLPTFFVGLTLITLFHHGAILYSRGSRIDYFGVTQTWWELTNLRCFFINLEQEATLFDPTGNLRQFFALLSYLV